MNFYSWRWWFVVLIRFDLQCWNLLSIVMRLRTKLSQAHEMRYIQILFKFLSDQSQELEQRNSKKHLIGWFKQLELNQIRRGPLKESQMMDAWLKLLKFPNNHFQEIRNWLAHYGGKIYYFSFWILSRFLKRLVEKQISYFSFNCRVSILIDVRHLSRLRFLFLFRFFPICLD